MYNLITEDPSPVTPWICYAVEAARRFSDAHPELTEKQCAKLCSKTQTVTVSCGDVWEVYSFEELAK